MSLINTVQAAMNFARNPRSFTQMIWAELTALDTRISNGTGMDITTVTGDVTVTKSGSNYTSAIGSNKVTSAKMAVFVSTVQTATGSTQNVAHGLGVTPATVVIVPVSTLAGATAFSFTKGNTNVVVTGTNTATYIVFAIA